MPPKSPRSSRKSSSSSEIGLRRHESAVRVAGSYDEAFHQAGFGLWQYFLLLQCGWANASDAIEILSVSLIIPAVRDTMGVSHAELSLLTIVLFVGMMIGGYLWGSLADIYGRKKVVSFSLTVNAVFAALSALSKHYWTLLLLRLISGIGVGGSLPVVFSYFGEFQPSKYRGAMLSALATCWMAGNMLSAGLAWWILPESNGWNAVSPFGQQWRLFVILCTIPCLSSAAFFWFVPESPKFLYKNGRLSEALGVLRVIHKWNSRLGASRPFRITSLVTEGETNEASINDETDHLLGETSEDSSDYKLRSGVKKQQTSFTLTKYIWYSLKITKSQLKSQLVLIYGEPRRISSIALTFVYVFVAFGGYGMAMWTPVLMEKTENFGGSPCRGHEGNASAVNTSTDPTSVYSDVFIGAASQLPGNVLTVFLMDKFGAKAFTLFSCAFSGLSVLGFWLVDTRIQVVVMNAVYQCTSTIVWNSMDVITVEMFPTSVRSTATGHMCSFGRLGSILGTTTFALFMDLNCSVPILTVFIVYILAALASFKLPNTRNITLQ